MKTPNTEDTTVAEETKPIDPLFDLDLTAEDADGRAIAPANIITKAGQPVLATWTVGTGRQAIKHKCVLDLVAVPYELWISDDNWKQDFLLAQGITGEEDVINDLDAREQLRQANAAIEESEEWWTIKANIVLAAIKRDKHNLPLITVPQVRANPIATTLASEPNRQLFGRKVINAIMRELNSFFV